MKIRKLLGTFLGLVLSASLIAQSNPGVDLLRLGELDLAKQHFLKQLRQQPADAYYYLGEVAWEQGNVAEAKDNYAKAMSSNPESLYSQVGAAKADLKTNEKEAKKALENLYKKNKKDVPLVLEVAKAFYDNGLIEDGGKAVDEARKSNKSNPLIYIMEGNRFLKQGKTGDAAMQYDQASNFDSKNTVALIRSGKVYENVNSTTAINQYKKAIEVDPSNKLVNRYLAKVYSASGRYVPAIEIYSDYFMEDNFNVEDIRYFSNALYFNKNYSEAREILVQGLDREKDNFVFNRLMMYTENELKNYKDGLDVAEHLFTLRADSGYIDKDFMTYGHLLTQNNREKDALGAYEKAIELNPDNVDLYRELASTMATDKLYESSVDYMGKYIEIMGTEATQADYFSLGRYNQSAGQALAKDSLPEIVNKRTNFYQNADVAYGVVTEKLPDSYLGYYMRAAVNSLLDPEIKLGLAKPYYEKTVEVIKANDEMEQRQSVLLVAYEYLAVYYLYRFDESESASDKEKALEYCELSIALNPDKASILQIREVLNQR